MNLAGEYMDAVVALTLEWIDGRLTWEPVDVANGHLLKTIEVDSETIWTPNVDFANRIHDYSPITERPLKSTVHFTGTF